MCLYCNMGDYTFRHDPPWRRTDREIPWVPAPVGPDPLIPWKLEKLQEYYDLLKKVKELEDKLGCPCEPNKADYLKMFADKIAEEKAKRSP